ncbi:MAG TPA: homoserine O-acetyltransferase [Candidatus Nanopelagicales bacterium]|nr:homoserine O-acetyltransferase [Candidatus Nanopelagicales bacterium]
MSQAPRSTGPLSYEGHPPASAAWREGDPVGERHFVDLGALRTESGFEFPSVRVAYETWGTLDADASNAVYVAHALTGDSHVTGEAGPGHVTAGWWTGLVGPGCPIDTDKWFVVCANVLGGCQGTTGPVSLAPDGRPWGSRFPTVTVGDMVEVERAVSDYLGIEQWAMMLGPSLGGMRVLEWMARYPARVRGGLVLGSTAAVTADQIGTHAAQIEAIRLDPNFQGGDYYDAPPGQGPHRGMGVARRIAHLTYRSETELDLRFGRGPQASEDPYEEPAALARGRFAVESYLDHHADKLARRFDANTYIALTEAMTLFDLGRGRGGVATALSQIQAPLTVVGIDSDRLFPLRLQAELAELTPGADELHVLRSPYGHDGFLVEDDQVGAFIAHAFDRLCHDPSRAE